MLGTSPFILVGDDGSGAGPVIFDSGVILHGSPGAGTIFDVCYVTTPFITSLFFTIVTS
jgi:hypothetical protein